VKSAAPAKYCLPFWQLVATWTAATTILAVLTTRWIGWTAGPNPAPQAWLVAAPALALLAASAIALLGSLLRQLLAERRLAEWVRPRAIPIPAHLAAAVAEAGIPRCRLVREQRPSAFTFGAVRPVVVVTSGLTAELDSGSLQAILLHEAAHVRARDPGRLLLTRAIAAALLAFPPASRAESRCHQWIELAADRAALAQLGRRPLAAALLALTERPGWVRPRTSASVVEAGDLLPARLLQLSEYPTVPPLPPASLRREKLASVALLAAVATLAALPCTLFVALLDRISSGGGVLW
jgi:Zn-dependent protease with chaperone function